MTAALAHPTVARDEPEGEPVTFYVLVPDFETPGGYIAVFADGSTGPAPRA